MSHIEDKKKSRFTLHTRKNDSMNFKCLSIDHKRKVTEINEWQKFLERCKHFVTHADFFFFYWSFSVNSLLRTDHTLHFSSRKNMRETFSLLNYLISFQSYGHKHNKLFFKKNELTKHE